MPHIEKGKAWKRGRKGGELGGMFFDMRLLEMKKTDRPVHIPSKERTN